MDYKELIEELRFLSAYVPEQMCDANGKDTLEKAADAIETLIAKHDTIMKMIHGECYLCKYQNSGKFDYPCWHCENGNGMDSLWELRDIEESEE